MLRPDSRPERGSASRLIGLDVLRFLAASVVVVDHSHNFGEAGKLYASTPGLIGNFFAVVSHMGWVAVHVFFVLSGFLISGLLFQEAARTGSVRVGRFLIRRGFKIYPAFWVMILAAVLWMSMNGRHIYPKALLGELCYLQNYGWFILFHTWSLAAEEHFYFLMAALVFFAVRFGKPGRCLDFKWVPRCFLIVAMGCLVLRGLVWFYFDINGDTAYLFNLADHTTLDSLFFGVFLAYGWHHCWSEDQKRGVVVWAIPLCAFGVILLLPFWMNFMGGACYRVFGFILLYLGSGCLVLASLSLDYLRSPAPVRWLAWLGKHSYSVYLWHLLVGFCVYPLLAIRAESVTGYLFDAVLYFILSWVMGVALARLIEFPMLRLRDRWFPSLAHG